MKKERITTKTEIDYFCDLCQSKTSRPHFYNICHFCNKHICNDCMEYQSSAFKHVYEPFPNNWDNDLLIFCRDCHKIVEPLVQQMDKEKRLFDEKTQHLTDAYLIACKNLKEDHKDAKTV